VAEEVRSAAPQQTTSNTSTSSREAGPSGQVKVDATPSSAAAPAVSSPRKLI